MIAKKISRFIRYYFAKAEKILLNRPAITGSSVIHQKAKVCSGSQINDTVLGRYSYIGHDCFTCQVQIGAFCSIADNCRIGGHKHAMERVSTSPVFEAGKNCLKTHFASHPRLQVPLTVIGNDVWIGAGVQIQSGITVGSGAVIGMGSMKSGPGIRRILSENDLTMKRSFSCRRRNSGIGMTESWPITDRI